MRHGLLAMTVAAMLGTLLATTVQAQDLTVDGYIALTVARLQAAEYAWLRHGRAPTSADTETLWTKYATTPADYVAFGSRNRLAVEAYLARNPAIRADIEQRSQRIRALVSQTETKP
jgi:hypothetical protein